jgi:hypothetical protein
VATLKNSSLDVVVMKINYFASLALCYAFDPKWRKDGAMYCEAISRSSRDTPIAAH